MLTSVPSVEGIFRHDYVAVGYSAWIRTGELSAGKRDRFSSIVDCFPLFPGTNTRKILKYTNFILMNLWTNTRIVFCFYSDFHERFSTVSDGLRGCLFKHFISDETYRKPGWNSWTPFTNQSILMEIFQFRNQQTRPMQHSNIAHFRQDFS